MTDRELLELAAKAAGMTLGAWRDDYRVFMYRDATPGRGYWNPLEVDGDAARLAVKLNLEIELSDGGICYVCARPYDFMTEQPIGDDPYAATRRAIVRAAAEIGKTMQ